jgi:hypothetical protein
MHAAIVVVAAIASLALAGTARADWTLGPGATGMTRDVGGGTYEISGTYTDAYAPNGFGRYSGTITAPGDFTSCRDVQVCTPGILSHCNVATGSVTFQAGVRLVTAFISSYPSGLLTQPVVCQLPGTTTRVYALNLVNFYLPTETVRGYGHLFMAIGSMFGTSMPRNDSIHEDSFDFFSLLVLSAS